MPDHSERPYELVPEKTDFVATVRGLDLGEPLDAAVLDALRADWSRFPVLVIPDQAMTPAELECFAGRFGTFGHDPYVAPLEGHEHVIEVRREAHETAPIFGSAWHSDWSFQSAPPSATVLYGAEIPPVGGDTVFASGYESYAALSPAMRNLLGTLDGVHSAAPAYGPRGLFARDDHTRSMRIRVSPAAEACQTHPIVRRHPGSQRKTLFINPVYTTGIDGFDPAESRALLDFLCKHMTRSKFTFRYRWSPGAVVIWDNRCVLHYADGGYAGHRRVMYRTTLAGERPAA